MDRMNERGQAVVEAFVAIFVFAIAAVALLPPYYSIVNSVLAPALTGQTYGSIVLGIFYVLPILVGAGTVIAVIAFFRPRVTQYG